LAKQSTFGDAPVRRSQRAVWTRPDLADPSDYSTHVNQLILAKQLIEYGANVNAVTTPEGETPLHNACCGDVVTNLDFVELLLRKGADPNFQDYLGLTPLMSTLRLAPGAAKFLPTDVNITTQSGGSFLAGVRVDVKYFRSDHPEKVEHQLLLRQWREVEEMLVERGAVDTGIATGLVCLLFTSVGIQCFLDTSSSFLFVLALQNRSKTESSLRLEI
jgi:ankyrin repeat protein